MCECACECVCVHVFVCMCVHRCVCVLQVRRSRDNIGTSIYRLLCVLVTKGCLQRQHQPTQLKSNLIFITCTGIVHLKTMTAPCLPYILCNHAAPTYCLKSSLSLVQNARAVRYLCADSHVGVHAVRAREVSHEAQSHRVGAGLRQKHVLWQEEGVPRPSSGRGCHRKHPGGCCHLLVAIWMTYLVFSLCLKAFLSVDCWVFLFIFYYGLVCFGVCFVVLVCFVCCFNFVYK